jgi:hypothetical protein
LDAVELSGIARRRADIPRRSSLIPAGRSLHRSPPAKKRTFHACRKDTITRKKGVAIFKHGEQVGGADVIFGEEGDSTLLGAFTLEALGLALDPFKRELRPLPMILPGHRGAR